MGETSILHYLSLIIKILVSFIFLIMKKTHRPKIASDFLTRRLKSRQLIQKAQQHTQLLELVKSLSPENFRSHLVVAEQKQNILVLVADSPIWASRYRFSSPALLSKLKAQNYFFIKVIVSVSLYKQASLATSEKKKIERSPIPKKEAQALEAMAQNIENPALKAALLNLTKHSEK